MIEQRIDVNATADPVSFRWGIVGLRNVGTAHMAAIMEVHHRMGGFSSRNPTTRSGDTTAIKFNMDPDLGRLFSVEGMCVVDDYHALIAEDCDGFIVCVPTEMHMQVAIEVAKKGGNCFLEKPMALTSEQAIAIREAFSSSKGQLVVGHVLPYFPAYDNLLQLVRQHGGIKSIAELRMERWVPWARTDDKADTLGRGGFFKDLAAHDAHFLSCIGQPNAVRVFQRKNRYEQVQYAQAKVYFEGSDAKVTFDVGAKPGFTDDFRHAYTVKFKDGSTSIFDGSTVLHDGIVQTIDPFSIPKIFGRELQVAADYFWAKRPDADVLAPDNAIAALKIIEAAERSAPIKATMAV